MRNVLFSVFTLLVSSCCIAQHTNYLVMVKREGIKEKALAEGEYVVVKSLKGEKVRGKLQIKTDKLIQVQNRVIPLTNVRSIGSKNGFVSKTASLILSNGMNLLLFGVNENLRQGFEDPSNFYKAGIPMTALGFPLYFISRKYHVRKWTYVGVLDPW